MAGYVAGDLSVADRVLANPELLRCSALETSQEEIALRQERSLAWLLDSEF